MAGSYSLRSAERWVGLRCAGQAGRPGRGPWLAQRLPEAARRRQSRLDLLVPGGWEADWTTELLQLLHALTRLREVESTQRGLLDEVLDGPLISLGDLLRGLSSAAAGVPALAE